MMPDESFLIRLVETAAFEVGHIQLKLVYLGE